MLPNQTHHQKIRGSLWRNRTGRPCRLIAASDKGIPGVFLTIIFPAYFPEAKAGGAFLILPYSTGHSGHVTGTQTSFVARAQERAKDGFCAELAPSVILWVSSAITDGLCGLRAAATDDAHPETVVGHSRHLLTGVRSPTCKIPTPRRV